METVIIAVGSNLGNRLKYLADAGKFLCELSEGVCEKASLWESEPIGGARFPFLNSALKIETTLLPAKLLSKLKHFEHQSGREKHPVRWGPRVLDLDIICYGNLVIDEENLIIPHPEYHRRLFVLYPMREVLTGWSDPVSKKRLDELIREAPGMDIKKTELSW